MAVSWNLNIELDNLFWGTKDLHPLQDEQLPALVYSRVDSHDFDQIISYLCANMIRGGFSGNAQNFGNYNSGAIGDGNHVVSGSLLPFILHRWRYRWLEQHKLEQYYYS